GARRKLGQKGGDVAGLQGNDGQARCRHARLCQASAGGAFTLSWMVTRLVISYSFVPEGTRTSTTSPSSWLRRHLPIGDEGEMRPWAGSVSSGVTMSYVMASPLVVSLS